MQRKFRTSVGISSISLAPVGGMIPDTPAHSMMQESDMEKEIAICSRSGLGYHPSPLKHFRRWLSMNRDYCEFKHTAEWIREFGDSHVNDCKSIVCTGRSWSICAECERLLMHLPKKTAQQFFYP